jgi:hypothetical protein
MTVILDHMKRPDHSLIIGTVVFLAFCIGMLVGNRINDTAHRQAAEQRIQATRATWDLDGYRACQDAEAPAHAVKAALRYVRKVKH